MVESREKRGVVARGRVSCDWVRDENGALRRETIHSMLRRLKGWDYRARAIYQITITIEDRASGALGRLEVMGPAGWVSVGKAKGLGLALDEIEAKTFAVPDDWYGATRSQSATGKMPVAPFRVISVDGAPVAVTEKDGVHTLPLSDEPVYVVFE